MRALKSGANREASINLVTFLKIPYSSAFRPRPEFKSSKIRFDSNSIHLVYIIQTRLEILRVQIKAHC